MQDSVIYEKILANMRDGVLTLDLEGRIVAFNKAAGHILRCDPDEVIGRSFAEVFIGDESLDDFNEVVLRAIYEAEVTHSQDIAVKRPEQHLNLFVSSTFLLMGGDQRAGVIVVFSDVTEQRKRRKIKQLFGEYIDPRIVERILARSKLQEDRGHRAVMSVAFTDLRDFTGWSERLDPETLIQLINSYLSHMSQAVGSQGGITDKYIGDAIMAIWGPPYTDPTTQARDACHAALEQRRRLVDLRREFAALPRGETLDASCGIATGEVVAGDVGPAQNRNYTVIGDTVNLSARLQDSSKLFGHPIVVSAETRRLAGEDLNFRELDTIVLRGRKKPEQIHALLGLVSEASDEQKRLSELYSQALALYRGRDWEGAIVGFANCLALHPKDKSVRVMLARSQRLSERPPPEEWDGVCPD